MKVIDDYPPNFDRIAAAFPEAKRKGVMFTYGPVIYAPHGIQVPSALKMHEQVHCDRQAEIGVERWWDQYIVDVEFRFNEELLAHRVEYGWFRKYRPDKRSKMLRELAERLSSKLYGSMVSRSDAQKMILVGGAIQVYAGSNDGAQ